MLIVEKQNKGLVGTRRDPDSPLADVRERLYSLTSPEEAEAWLAARNQWLGGEAPLVLIGSGRVQQVLNLIEIIEAGITT